MMVCGNCLLKSAVPRPDWRSWIGIIYGKTSCIVGGSLKRLKLAENLLWIGEVDAAMPAAGYAYALFVDKREKTGKEFLCIFEQASKSDYQLRLLSGGTDLLYWFWICGVCY